MKSNAQGCMRMTSPPMARLAWGTPGGNGQDQWSHSWFLWQVHHGFTLQVGCSRHHCDAHASTTMITLSRPRSREYRHGITA
jgi:hypothetical protein